MLRNTTLRAALVLILMAASPGWAETEPRPQASGQDSVQKHFDAPDEAELDSKLPVGEVLSGETIYDRFLENRRTLETATQIGTILSKDPGGHDETVRYWIYWKDYTDEDDEPVDNLYDRWVLKMIPPADLEHTGYLYEHVDEGTDKEFMYSPYRGRTFRIKLKGQQVAGTDFSFDDFLLSLDDIEDATYKRHPDEVVQGVDVYVVEAFPRESSRAAYSRTMHYIEQEHYVPIAGRYWNEAGVESKTMSSPHGKIENFEGMWVARETSVTDLLEGTSSTLVIDELIPNDAIEDEDFAITALQQSP